MFEGIDNLLVRRSALFVLLAFAALLQGCAIAPGMTMTEPAEVDEENVIQVQPITLELLQQIEVDRRNEVTALAEEFSTEQSDYIIGKGDVLMVTVWDHPELTIPAGSFRNAEEAGQQVGVFIP